MDDSTPTSRPFLEANRKMRELGKAAEEARAAVDEFAESMRTFAGPAGAIWFDTSSGTMRVGDGKTDSSSGPTYSVWLDGVKWEGDGKIAPKTFASGRAVSISISSTAPDPRAWHEMIYGSKEPDVWHDTIPPLEDIA